MQSQAYEQRQGIVRREWPALFKRYNAGFAHKLGSLWASHKGLIHVVATLGHRMTMTGEWRLVAKPFVTRCIRQYHLDRVLGPVNTNSKTALPPQIGPGKARGERFGDSK